MLHFFEIRLLKCSVTSVIYRNNASPVVPFLGTEFDFDVEEGGTAHIDHELDEKEIRV
jgi:hypothetical protein